ncbi:MAG: YggT family protein [Acidimicrobiales bacterium]|jgi:YggT family protein
MSSYLTHPLYTLGVLYLLVLVFRAVLSWFPVGPRSPMRTVNHWLYVLTEPVVAPFRKVIPPVGIFDISYMIACLVVYLLTVEVFARIHV